MTAVLDASITTRVGDFGLDAELRVANRETVAVVGPNGAGKTTLLRALCGLQPIDRGRIVLDGTPLDDVERGVHIHPEHRSLGVVFQDYLLFPHMTVLDNVAFGLRSRGLNRSVANERARAWLTRVELPTLADRRPPQLSGGQAQRVALARALATSPRLLLLDEPLAALDATTRASTRRDLRRHLDQHDGARVVITHDPVDAAALADRLVVLEAGRIVQEGTLSQLTEQPRSRYVADFLGVNMAAGRATHGRVDLGALVLTVADDAEGDVLITIPPRAVTLSLARPEGTARNVWRGEIEHFDRLGDRVRVRVGGPITVVAEITESAVDDLGLRPGVAVWVAIKATEVQVTGA